MNNPRKKVIVFGGNHHNPLGVIRALGRKGLCVFFLTSSKISFVEHSKYISETIYIERDEDAPEVLINRFSEEDVKPVIVCCGDGFASIIMRNREILKEKFIVPFANVYNEDNIFFKDFQSKIAQECDIKVPQSGTFDLSNANSILQEWKIFPCIIKPLNSLSNYGGKGDIRIADCYENLVKILRETQSEKIQVQQYIEKKMEFQLIGCSLDAGNEVIIPGYTHILRQPPNTNTGFLKIFKIENLSFDLGKIKKFMQKVGYSGLFSVEFLRNDDTDFFMEVNFRNDGNAYVVTQAGVNLPYIWTYFSLFNKLPLNEPTTLQDEIFFLPELQDLRNVFHRKLSLISFLKDFLRTKAPAVFDIRDLSPFICQFLFPLKNYICKKIQILK